MNKVFSTLFLAAFALLFLSTCDKGQLKSNGVPDTKIALESINLQGQFRLNSVVALSWFGTDKDGYVKGYEISFDNATWTYTEKVDSTFRFSIPAGSDTVDVNFFVRAIDNDNNIDPTPATLRIPLKNSLPEARFDEDNYPLDTVTAVTTYRWFGSDPDGDETITTAEMKWNNGSWFEIDPNQPLLTFVADTNATGNAALFYANNKTAAATVPGVNLNSSNTLYLRVKDIAGAYSAVDTAAEVYIKKPTSQFLVIGGQPNSVTQVYKPILDNIGQPYDFVDYAATDAQLNPLYQPKFWSPTFRHFLMLYSKVFIYADATLYNNPSSGQSQMLLTFMGPAVQEFTDDGRKILVSTTFSAQSDMSGIEGIYPVENIVLSNGQVRISNDSSIFAVTDTLIYPRLTPQNILIGIYPIIKTADAEDFYRAELTKLSGWQGDNLVGVRRRYNGNINHVFFGVGLYQFTKDLTALENLLDQILTDDFDW